MAQPAWPCKRLGRRFSDTVSCLRGWWAQLKEDCDKNPDQKREPKDLTPEDALRSFSRILGDLKKLDFRCFPSVICL